MKRKVIILKAYREFRTLRRNGPTFDETSLGAAYGLKLSFVMLCREFPLKN
jgi:hypothetical protein